MVSAIVSLVLMAVAAQPATNRPAIPQQEAPAMKANLASTLEAWIGEIEADDASAAARLAVDAKAAAEISENWARLRANHKRFNYRIWIDKSPQGESASKIGDATSFKVGGHEYGHLHIDWTKTAAGWRIEKVWPCR